MQASTFLGGTASDHGRHLTLAYDANGYVVVYVTGCTFSPDFPTTNRAYDTSFNSAYDITISKLNGGLTNLLTSTYLGGYYADDATAIALNSNGRVFVAGSTWYKTDFPTTMGAYDTT